MISKNITLRVNSEKVVGLIISKQFKEEYRH